MKKLIISLLLVFLIAVPMACAKETTPASRVQETSIPNATANAPMGVPPGTPGAANDDIVTPPGGFSYRANVHQQGEPDWPPVQQTEATLWNLTRVANITYRSNIETGTGETRNNLFYLKVTGFPSLDPLKTIYEPVSLPEGFTLERREEMYGGIGGMDKTASRIVMSINIAGKMASGEYSFQFKVIVDGAEFGNVPCTVKVVQNTVNPQPITSPPPPKTDRVKGSPPPEGIGGWQQPRALTEDEKAKAVEIAVSSYEALAWLQGRTDYRVAPVDWYAIIWRDGKAGEWWASEYKIVDEGIPSYVSPNALWYPGVTIAVGQGTIYQMQIAVDLDVGKTVMIDGPYPSLSSPDRFPNSSPPP